MARQVLSSSLWRQEVLTRVQELEIRLSWASVPPEKQRIADAVGLHLHDALKAAEAPAGRGLISGSTIQGALYNIAAAEVTLLRLQDPREIAGLLPDLVATAAESLPAHDQRLIRLTELNDKVSADRELEEFEIEAVIAAITAAKKAALRAQNRVRGFRNVIFVMTGLVLLVVLTLALVGLFAPEILPLCQVDYVAGTATAAPNVICPASGKVPSPGDSLIVMFAGLIGATLSAVFSIKNVRGSSEPFSVPVAQILLKLPTGALTAIIGLLLIRGGFTPGFTGLDSSPQIFAYSVLFGYAQQLFTSLVDRQANSILAASPGSGPVTQADPAARRAAAAG